MARRADGRVNSTDRTKRYTPDTFEDGSAVRRLAAQPQEVPKEARPLKSGVSSQTRRNRARATQISAGYAVFLAIVCTLCIAACVAYVKLQTVVTTQAEDITSKEKELSDHGGGLYTVYMHCSSLAVSEGTAVSAGQTIAYVGSTGISTGNHLHFGVSLNGSYVSPWSYLKG